MDKGNLFGSDGFKITEINEENKEYKPSILITGAVLNSDEESIHTYEKLVCIIDQNKYDVYSPLDTMKFIGSDEKRYQKAMQLLKKANFIIAEMSNVSCGQGMELQEAVRLDIPILVIARNDSKISGLVKGCGKVVDIIYYDRIEEVKNKVLKYI